MRLPKPALLLIALAAAPAAPQSLPPAPHVPGPDEPIVVARGPLSWIIHMLVDVVSKNGNLLINIVQRPDGTLDPDVEAMPGQMAGWIAVNGEAIYGTRPWTTFGEGPVRAEGGAFREDAAFGGADVRFTTKGDTLYAFVLGWPEEPLTIRALGTPAGRVTAVRLLGYDGDLRWRQEAGGLTISPPAKAPSDYAVAFAIRGLLPSAPRPE